MKKEVSILCILLIFACTATLQAAFIVEPYDGSSTGTPNIAGLAYDHFSGTPRFSSTGGSAAGLTASHSAYGSTGVHEYVLSYTPGVDADNWTVPLGSRYFGNGHYSTNLAGGQSGYYNVYITWPASTSVNAAGCNIGVSHDGGVTLHANVDMNTGQTVAMAMADNPDAPDGTIFYGGNNAWLRIGAEVLLTSGNTYTVTQTANSTAWTSMRNAGVMWEFVSVPEPASLLLLGLGATALRRRK